MWLSRAFLVIMGRLQTGQIYWKVPGKWIFSTWFTTLFFWAPVLPHSVHLNRLPSSRTSFSTYFSKILRSFMPATEVVKSSGDRKKPTGKTIFYWLSMILFHVDFPTVMALELLGTELADIAWREVCMGSLNVLPHVVHIPAPFATQQTDNTAAINSLLAVGLQVVVRIWEGILQWWITILLCVLLIYLTESITYRVQYVHCTLYCPLMGHFRWPKMIEARLLENHRIRTTQEVRSTLLNTVY